MSRDRGMNKRKAGRLSPCIRDNLGAIVDLCVRDPEADADIAAGRYDDYTLDEFLKALELRGTNDNRGTSQEAAKPNDAYGHGDSDEQPTH